MRAHVIGAAVAAVVGLGSAVAIAEVAPEAVKFTDDNTVAQSLTDKGGDAAAGRKWFVGRKLGNCLACHVNTETSEEQFHGEVGPPLDGVAERYSAEQLRAIIVNPKKVFGDQTVMPAFYRTAGFHRVGKKFAGKTILNAQQVEDIVAYLRSLK